MTMPKISTITTKAITITTTATGRPEPRFPA